MKIVDLPLKGYPLVTDDSQPRSFLDTSLLSHLRIDPLSGDLVIENGKARLVLQKDGTIRLQGLRIVGSADETIAFDAAMIELN
jgi:hypothetical protein